MKRRRDPQSRQDLLRQQSLQDRLPRDLRNDRLVCRSFKKVQSVELQQQMMCFCLSVAAGAVWPGQRELGFSKCFYCPAAVPGAGNAVQQVLLNGITAGLAVFGCNLRLWKRESFDTCRIDSGAGGCELVVGVECTGFVEAAFCWVYLRRWQRGVRIRQI